MPYDRIAKLLAEGRTVLLDGAIGTEIQKRAPELPRTGFGTLATLQAPDVVRAIHADYIAVGADVITTNTFRASRMRMRADGVEDDVEDLNRKAVELAREAREAAQATERVAIAGSISPANPNEAAGTLDDYNAYLEQARLLAESGVDLLLLEMLRDVRQAQSAIAAARETGLPVWAGFSTHVDDDGTVRLLEGSPPPTFDEALDEFAPLQIDAGLIMHTVVDDVGESLEVLAKHWDGPLGAYPHAGDHDRQSGRWVFGDNFDTADLADFAAYWKFKGAQIFGACCGMGPRYIDTLVARMR